MIHISLANKIDAEFIIFKPYGAYFYRKGNIFFLRDNSGEGIILTKISKRHLKGFINCGSLIKLTIMISDSYSKDCNLSLLKRISLIVL